MLPLYQLYFHHDGNKFIATVQELEGCYGAGKSYAEALANVEKAIEKWLVNAAEQGQKIPEPANDFVLRQPTKPIANGHAAPIMRELRLKYGNLNNRQLMEKMGIENVSPSSFSGATAGCGARWVRCAIAIALNKMPSELWPHISSTTLMRDDYYTVDKLRLSR